jgi:hypothetical protein
VDRRTEDRRRPAPISWTAADHLLAECAEVDSSVAVGPVEKLEERRSV